MNHFKKIVLAAVVAAAGISTSVQAETITGHPASLIGETVTPSVNGQASSSFTISANKDEFGLPGTVWYFLLPQYNSKAIAFDFGVNTLTITTPAKYNSIFGAVNNTATTWGNFGSVTFSGFDAFITGFNLVSNKGFGTDFTSDFTHSDHSITFDLDGGLINGGFSGGANSKLVFNVTAVPEPATTALLGLGLLGFAASRRKSAKSKNA